MKKEQEIDFLTVGLGNVDKMPIIEDGDIQQYPVMAYKSKGLMCHVEKQSAN